MILRKSQGGHIAMIALIITLASLALSLGYLRWVLGERVMHLRRLAQVRAQLNAHEGLASYGYQIAVDPNFVNDSSMVNIPVASFMQGLVDSVVVGVGENITSNRVNRIATAVGSSHYPSFTGEDIHVFAKVYTAFQPQGFEEFMYFTNEELPGGGPWLGSYVSFGTSDVLEGRVHSNGSIRMSEYGCPDFADGSDVTTSGTFMMANCSENQVFGENVTYSDSVPKIKWPPFTGLERVRENADYFYNSAQKIRDPSDGTSRDTLIMTELTFIEGGFTVNRWMYVMPPFTQNGMFDGTYTDTMQMYHPTKTWGYAGGMNFWSFDYYPGMPGYIGSLSSETIYDNRAVIYVHGGQVIVKGTVSGEYTVATSSGTDYRLHANNTTIEYLPGNIWITGDLVYTDSYSSGAVKPNSPFRMGLLAGGNVIVANTLANGGGNQALGSDIKINAAIIAMDESFLVHYWQNTATNEVINYQKGDGRGPVRIFNNPNATTGSDVRGTINLWGSVVQTKRGYVMRNNPGPYPVSPGIGYYKNYNYDYNLLEYPPPYWPETQTVEGGEFLKMASYGEVVY
ncbi:MAG: hypothetical protein K9N36_05840 [Candidatus Marinimicrobia bacterium]|nr:hypothetical protein [Candidatus Neomarinimicrobiota bacterium]